MPSDWRELLAIELSRLARDAYKLVAEKQAAQQPGLDFIDDEEGDE